MSNYTDVRDFQLKFGMLVHDKPVHLTLRKLNERRLFMQEELNEFLTACVDQDLAGQADALIDLVYVALGTAISLGLPWEALWDDVQRANIGKVRGIGKRGDLVDVIKPPDWVGPSTELILAAAGYVQAIDSRRENHHDDPIHLLKTTDDI